MDDDEWREATCIRDQYQVQYSRKGRWRHRPLKLGNVGFLEDIGYGPWTEGRPPDNKMPS